MSIKILTKEESIELQREINEWWDKLDEHWKMVIHNCFENNIFHKIEMDREKEVQEKEQLKCKHEFRTVKFAGDKEETTYCHKCGKVLKEKTNGWQIDKTRKNGSYGKRSKNWKTKDIS